MPLRPAIGILDPHFRFARFWIGYAAHQFLPSVRLEFPGYGGQHLAGIVVSVVTMRVALVLGGIVLRTIRHCTRVRRFKFGRYRQHVD